MKHRNIWVVVVSLFIGGHVQAQQSNIPAAEGLRPSSTASTDVSGQIDQLLNVSSGEMMNGISGYGMDLGSAITQKVMDEVMKAVASAVVFAPAAAEILAVYEKEKSTNLATAIGQVKDVVKDRMSKQLKVRYQTYKTTFEASEAGMKMNESIRNSMANIKSSKSITGMNAAMAKAKKSVMDASDKVTTASQKADRDLMLAIDQLGDPARAKSKLAMSNQEYDSGDAQSEVTSMSAYERIMMKRETLAETRQQEANVKQLANTATNMARLRANKAVKKHTAKKLGLKDTY